MPYERTIAAIRAALHAIRVDLDPWFDRPAELRRFRPADGGWTIDEVLEHLTLTNRFLLLTLRKHAALALRRAARTPPVAGESDLGRLEIVGRRGSFRWHRPAHMEPTGVPSSPEVKALLESQFADCEAVLARLAGGEGSSARITMTVADLGKLDLYQWTYFLVLHARRHLAQLAAIEAEYADCPADGGGLSA